MLPVFDWDDCNKTKTEVTCAEGVTGAGQKTPEIFVSGSSNKNGRHIRFKLGRAARFTKRKNGVSIC